MPVCLVELQIHHKLNGTTSLKCSSVLLWKNDLELCRVKWHNYNAKLNAIMSLCIADLNIIPINSFQFMNKNIFYSINLLKVVFYQ